MDKKDLILKDIPDTPGVYFFLGEKEDILYVGKATSLRDRIKSYFAGDIAEVRSPLIAKIVNDARSISFEQTDSVLEAVILEAKLIKKHRPIGNTSNKDNKSWNYVVITNEPLPRVLMVRERELRAKFAPQEVQKLFGPFPSAATLREALKIVRKIFPYFDTEFRLSEHLTSAQQKKVRFNQSLGIFPSSFNTHEYAKNIRAISDIFSGKKDALVARLQKEMHRAAQKQEFEIAELLKRQVFALTHIKDITLIKEDLKSPDTVSFRIEAYDVAHLKGSSTRGVMVVVVDGEAQRSEYRLFTIRTARAGDDYAALDELLIRRFKHCEWSLPHVVAIDGGRGHLARAKKTLADVGFMGEIVSVVKDEKHRPREVLGNPNITFPHESSILLANSEAHRFAISRHRSALRKKGVQ